MTDNNNCMAARAADEANNNMLVDDDDSDDNYFDWEKIVHETETAEDDSSDFDMEEDEEVPTDDDLSQYVISDDDSVLGNWGDVHDVEMLPRGDSSDAPRKSELSEDSKALLFWRHETNGNNFSDWKIKVEALKSDCDYCGEEMEAVTYNVHRFALAMGPKKSGYFEACFSLIATVRAPIPQESNFVINFENWESMKYLADYFLVPRLTEAVVEFIEKDMECFNPDHMEKYISEFQRDISSDMARRILPKAAHVCAKMFQSIDVDSPLLKSIPPAMFRSILQRIISCGEHYVIQQDAALHTCSLIASYFDHNVEDIEVFGFCCDRLDINPRFYGYANDKSDDRIMEVVLTWFRLMAKKGWNAEKVDGDGHEYYNGSYIGLMEFELARITNEYLSSKTPSPEIMDKIVRDSPCHVVSKAFRKSLDEARRFRESQGQARPGSGGVGVGRRRRVDN